MNTPSWQRDPARYDFRHTVALQYGHLDTIRHVNNVAAHGLHLEARMRYQMTLLGDDVLFSDDVLLRPQRTITHFLRETHYPHDVTIAAQPIAVDRDGYRLITALFQHDVCVGIQDCRMGAWQADAWHALPDATRMALEARLARIDAAETAPWPDVPPCDIRLADYPLAANVSGRYADLDPDGVIGELALSRYVEQSRAGSLRPIRDDASLGMLVASVDLCYHRWHHGITDTALGCGIDRIGNSSFSMAGAVATRDTRLATARTAMVVIDAAQRRPTPIGGRLREAMLDLFVGAPHETGGATRATAGHRCG